MMDGQPYASLEGLVSASLMIECLNAYRVADGQIIV